MNLQTYRNHFIESSLCVAIQVPLIEELLFLKRHFVSHSLQKRLNVLLLIGRAFFLSLLEMLLQHLVFFLKSSEQSHEA